MTADILFRLLMGHLVGDYLLQSNMMALNKKKNFWWAALHCACWTLVVCFFLLPELGPLPAIQSIQFIGAVILIWLSHMLLDYGFGTEHGLVNVWLRLIRSRSFENAIEYCESDEPELKKQFMVSYTAIVQTVTDNTLHLILLYLIVKYHVLGA